MSHNPTVSSPYVSVVVTARNDDHGGNMLPRMQAFVDAWCLQSKQYGLTSELIVIEWNPPADRPRLADSLRWPAGCCGIRLIEVSAEVHRRVRNADRIPLHQMAAKNVGIRRACGDFVLATNLDVILSAELMRFLASRELEKNTLYRADRYDVASDIPSGGTAEELLRFCESHILRRFGRGGISIFAPDGSRRVDHEDIVEAGVGIHLGPEWFNIESDHLESFRWIDHEAQIEIQCAQRGLVIDAETGASAGVAPLTIEVVEDGIVRSSAALEGRCELLIRLPQEFSGSLRLRVQGGGLPLTRDPRFLNLRVFRIRPARIAAGPWSLEIIRRREGVDWAASQQAVSPFASEMKNPAYLHTNACGDFTMLSRDDWFRLRGYPEFPIWPNHIDALLCYAAHHSGIREVILGDTMRAYHIEHSSGAGWTPEGEAQRESRIQASGVAELNYPDWIKYIDQMRRFNSPLIFTDENWGLADLNLPETRL